MSCGVSPLLCCEALDGAIGAACTVVTDLRALTEVAERGDHGDDDAAAEQGGDERDEERAFHCQAKDERSR